MYKWCTESQMNKRRARQDLKKYLRSRWQSHWDWTDISRGHLSHAKVSPFEGQRKYLHSSIIILETPRTSSHVTRALPSGLRFEVHVCTARPRSRGKWLTKRFLHPKTSQTYVWEERWFFLMIVEFCFKKTWMDENKHGSCELPPAKLKFQMRADGRRLQ